jgi:hypothetical protein
MCQKKLLCYQIFLYGGDKTEKLSNEYYADIYTYVRGFHKPTFCNIYEETSNRQAGYTNTRAVPGDFRSRVSTWMLRCQIPHAICMQIELCPKGNWLAPQSLSVPWVQSFITTLSLPLLTLFVSNVGDLYWRGPNVNATIKGQDAETKVVIKILSASCSHYDRKSKRIS